MTIHVTCAGASEASLIDPKDTTAVSKHTKHEEYRNVFMMAAEKAVRSGSEVFVKIEDRKHDNVGEREQTANGGS